MRTFSLLFLPRLNGYSFGYRLKPHAVCLRDISVFVGRPCCALLRKSGSIVTFDLQWIVYLSNNNEKAMLLSIMNDFLQKKYSHYYYPQIQHLQEENGKSEYNPIEHSNTCCFSFLTILSLFVNRIL